ncbi:hypothetical protein P3X46_026770 [Hevea brasiliensis]|uniref:Plant thionin family protein n=1 Tax=Hevea brasiliensis TaxID=3981 RepID=A0ABQ9KXR4_HEVBR|nr:hypothetical protein P3X46_026770 [Hevea brasiliensis]
MGYKSLVIIMALLFSITSLEAKQRSTASECVTDYIPICMKLYEAVSVACESACTLGCQQLQGRGPPPNRKEQGN